MIPALAPRRVRLAVLACVVLAACGARSPGPARTATPEAAPASGVALPAGFRHATVEANGQRLHVVIGGHGPPALLIHGWPETWYEWRKVMPLLAERYTVVVPDLPGFGDSSRPAHGYDKKTLAEDLFQAMTVLGHPRALLIGHDWGGPVAYAYAARHRDAVTALVVIEGAPFGAWTENKEPYWFFGFFKVPGYAEQVVAGHEREFLHWFYTDPHLTHGAIDDAARAEYSRTYASVAGITASASLYRAIDADVADNAVAAKAPLTIPVLAIGAQDGAGPGVGATMKQVATTVTPMTFAGVGHFIPEERPELLVQTIMRFLGPATTPQAP